MSSIVFMPHLREALASYYKAAGRFIRTRRRTSVFILASCLVFSVLICLQTFATVQVTSQLRQELRDHNARPLKPVNISDGETLFQPPLHTKGRYIVDANDKRVKIASINWYGASDIFFVAGGLDIRHRDEIAALIRKMGFNTVRFPYSDQMVIDNPVIPPELISANLDLLDDYDLTYDDSDLANSTSSSSSDVDGHTTTRPKESLRKRGSDEREGPRAMDVYVACVRALTDAGIGVVINNHITNAAWCDGFNFCDSSWKNDHYGPICRIRQTTDSWIENWRTVMTPFVDNPLVIGADLRNEPRGLWGTMTWNMWATAAEKAAEALLRLNPAWLMFVEGIASANDCSGARTRPVRLSVPNRVVYSSHVYSWSGWSTLVTYARRGIDSFRDDMEKNWGYLLKHDIAPVWVGEFGTPYNGAAGDRHYWANLMTVLREYDADFGYWSLNPRKPLNYDNETYGILRNDWAGPIEDYRYHDLRSLMKPITLPR